MHNYSRYWQALREQPSRVALAYLLSLFGVALTLALPWPLKFLIDDVLTGQAVNPLLAALEPNLQVLMLAAVMLGIAGLGAFVLAAEKVVHARVREHFGLVLRDALVQRIYGLSRFSRQAERSGELTMRLASDTQHVSRLFCKTVPTALKHAATALLTLVSLTVINPTLGVLALVLAVALAGVVRWYAPRVNAAAKIKRALEGSVSALTQETVQAIEHVQSMGLEAQSRARYLQRARESLKAGVREVKVAVHMERSTQLVAGLALAGIAAVGGLLVLDTQMSLGTLTVCLAYMTALLKPIEKINELVTSVSRGWVRLDRLQAVFAAPTSIVESSTETKPGLLEPALLRIDSIESFGLDYQYPDNSQTTIHDFNHRFVRGEMTVLVGGSGSGKSTLLRLLLRLLPPSHGMLCANGVDYVQIEPTQLRSQFAVVLQDAHHFAGSVREVLTELAPDADDAQLRRTLADVQLLELIGSLQYGLDSPMDESASQISGGQRARLMLARALLSERSVLVLDEPFANIDDNSKRIIAALLEQVKRRCILIVVTHEMSLVNIADHVFGPDTWQALPPIYEAANV